MGQQQILFLILGVCVIGIALSAGVITLQSNSSIDHRQVMSQELKTLADEALAYRRRPYEQHGGDGTFIGLTSTPYGIAKLTNKPLTQFGEFYIAKSGNDRSVQIMAVGDSPGIDPRKPIKMLMTVSSEAASIVVLN